MSLVPNETKTLIGSSAATTESAPPSLLDTGQAFEPSTPEPKNSEAQTIELTSNACLPETVDVASPEMPPANFLPQTPVVAVAPDAAASSASTSAASAPQNPQPTRPKPTVASILAAVKLRGKPLATEGIEGFVFSQKHAKHYVISSENGYRQIFAIGSPESNARIRSNERKKGRTFKRRDLDEVNEELLSQAEEYGVSMDLFPRVCPLGTGGVEIDLCDGKGTTVLIDSSGVKVLGGTSDTLFLRSASALALPVPADIGDYTLLRKYVHLRSNSFLIYIAWVTFTIVSGKIEATCYVYLVLKGAQGTGKSFASKISKSVIDPNTVAAQTLPGSARDLAIMLQSAHLLVVDNMRDLTTAISDILCIASTGGAVPMRKLYSDDDQKALFLHGSILFNGIHPFMGQSDFADRCLVLELVSIEPKDRKSESQMLAEFEADRPAIARGLYDLTSQILGKLPRVEVVAPSRMLDFCKWLAAMEAALELPVGVLQHVYADSLQDSQLESLLDNPLAVTIIEFAERQKEPEWVGTPTQFYDALTNIANFTAQRSRAWPSSAAVLSKRLHGLQAPLLAQGISIDWSRGKDRQIVVTKSPPRGVTPTTAPTPVAPSSGQAKSDADF
jgi:hypothetical protein